MLIADCCMQCMLLLLIAAVYTAADGTCAATTCLSDCCLLESRYQQTGKWWQRMCHKFTIRPMLWHWYRVVCDKQVVKDPVPDIVEPPWSVVKHELIEEVHICLCKLKTTVIPLTLLSLLLQSYFDSICSYSAQSLTHSPIGQWLK